MRSMNSVSSVLPRRQPARRWACIYALAVVVSGLVIACGGSATESPRDAAVAHDPNISPVPATRGDAGTGCETGITPGGRVPSSCVHEVPDGALVTLGDAGQTIVSKDGQVIATYPPCKCSSADAGTAGASE